LDWVDELNRHDLPVWVVRLIKLVWIFELTPPSPSRFYGLVESSGRLDPSGWSSPFQIYHELKT